MIKLIVGLTDSSIKQIITNDIVFSRAKELLYQHKILMSETLLKHYESFFAALDEKDLFQRWFQNVNRVDIIQECEPICEKYIDELYAQIKTIKHHIVITDKDECLKDCPPNIQKISIEELDSSTSDNQLSRRCIPACFFIRKGELLTSFMEWLKDVLSDEPYIKIIDGYVFNGDNGRYILDYYLPVTSNETKVHIYYAMTSSVNQTSISAIMQSKYGKRVKMHPSRPEDIHDRYIVCETFAISIGLGWDVFDGASLTARQETRISLANEGLPTIPRQSLNH